ncbi:AraC family transcriptional regulator [Streptomyces violarus]|uniref:AraC family transcriptional regulator n=1 Tax=Streptomyces violarus TaxID=67380 RepID=UPI0021C0ADD0|nr:AraC family transcriptional regulator [Streptomyces violarus]MCT9139803.1 AraC family transcriptional regulator [Streptomyces violarus]
MDPFSILLDGARARGTFVLRTILNPPWSVQVRDRVPLNLVAVLRGTPWVVPSDGDAVRLDAGDIALMRGPDTFTFADDPRTPTQVVVQPGPRRTTAAGAALPEAADMGVRTWVNGGRAHENGADGSSVLLIGKYSGPGEIATRLLRVMPPLLVVPTAAHVDSALVSLLAKETVRNEPGQDLVLERLLDLLLIGVLREWLTGPDADAPAWFRAGGDPVVGSVLRLIHGEPGRPWTVAALAREAGVSRATLARRFTDVVGVPPMAYLTGWRIDVAADLLVESDATIDTVARQVGYGSGFAFSAAFKRARGISPQRHRAHARNGP